LASALIYPAVLTSTAVLVVVFLLTFVVPRLSGVLNDLGENLPLGTKILLGTTGFLTGNWVWVVGGLVALVVLYSFWSHTEAGRIAKDRLKLRIPVAGRVIGKAVVSRYARVLGTLIYGGVPILEALRIAGLSSGNHVYEVASVQVVEDVRVGTPVGEAMRNTGLYPPVLTHMVAIGEQTGDLPTMLERVSDSLDFEVDTGLRRATSLVEPLIVLTMGAFVGFVVLSVLLPIYESQQLVK
jgi:type II secretory pathway component PulF